MTNRWLKLLSIFVSLVLIINLLPLQALASDIDETPQLPLSTLPEDGSSGSTTGYQRLDTATVVEEDTFRRGEYYKEFVLNNGLRLAAVYADPIHFEEDGQWKDIDNTLKAVDIKGISGYTNTAGVWQVYFPQQLTGSNAISVTKDGYTVSFGMAGELTNSGNIAVASIGTATDTLAVSSVRSSAAQIRAVDLTEQKAAAQYEQTVLEKHHSKLAYSSVYDNTEIVYDLSGNRLKESIVISKYDASLWGYRYNLNTGGLIPVLLEDNTIELRHPETAEVVMTMPAPFMVDANDEYSYDVTVSLVQKGSSHLLSYFVPRQWLASADRAWPVVLDPVIDGGNTVGNIQDITASTIGTHGNSDQQLLVGKSIANGVSRIYFRHNTLPELPSASVIIKATIALKKVADSEDSLLVEVHKSSRYWTPTTINNGDRPTPVSTVEDVVKVQAAGVYTWDITNIVSGWYSSTTHSLTNNIGLIFKASAADEGDDEDNVHAFYSSDNQISDADIPQTTIIYQETAGLEDYWDYTPVSAGRAGTGYIHNHSGNLVWVHNDMGFDGNRMPVSISHIFNSRDSSSNVMGLGYGWRTNYNQLLNYQLNTTNNTRYYIWEDGDGTDHYFYEITTEKYRDEDGLELTLNVLSTDSGYTEQKYSITDKLGNKSYFDSWGRLTSQVSNQRVNLDGDSTTSSVIRIVYADTSNSITRRISSITDGAGRVYAFNYNSDSLLNRIDYLGTSENQTHYSLSFTYDNGLLTGVSYLDGKPVSFTYASKNLLSTVTDVDGYKLTFAYNTTGVGKPSRIKSVSESYGSTDGDTTNFSYGYYNTKITTQESTRVHFFNQWSNTISVQDDQGRGIFQEYTPVLAQGDYKNQLIEASAQQVTVGNMLLDSSFEYNMLWTNAGCSDLSISSPTAYIGAKSMSFKNGGVQTGPFEVKNGESITFSAYLKSDNLPGVELELKTASTSLAKSSPLSDSDDWERLSVTYTNDSGATQTVYPKISMNSTSPVYVDCVQLEKDANANAYNLIQNGDFSNSSLTYWLTNGSGSVVTNQAAAAPSLCGGALKLTGGIDQSHTVLQTISVSGNQEDSFVISGWAKGDCLPPNGESDDSRVFALQVMFLDSFGNIITENEDIVINFNPHNADQWQYAAKEILAPGNYSGIMVAAIYNNNIGTAYFDGIGLYKGRLGDSYTYENGNLSKHKDVQGNITTYNYAPNGVDVSSVVLPTGTKMAYTYENGTHNVLTAQEYVFTGNDYVPKSTITYTYDSFGNVTATSYVTNEDVESITQTTSAVYTEDKNHLAEYTDETGETTEYGYYPHTGLLQWVQYPGDTAATRTEYEYDIMLRPVKTAATTDTGKNMSVEYAYTNDRIATIKSPKTEYTMTYGLFGQRTSVSIGTRQLAQYTYSEDYANRYLEELAYGNDDVVKYEYDTKGRVIEEKYENSDGTGHTVTYTYNFRGLMATKHDTATGITTKYVYDAQDRLIHVYDTGNRASVYNYDDLGNVSLTAEKIGNYIPVSEYNYDEQNRPSGIIEGDIYAHFYYDALNRKTGQSVYKYNAITGLDGVSTDSSIAYYEGSDRVHTLTVGGTTYTYSYDAKGNIKSIVGGGNNVSYQYDSQNQLIRENNQAAGKTWTWEYDNAGNIVYKREYAYTTGTLGSVPSTVAYGYPSDISSEKWKDLLLSYNGSTITYDTIGNPLSDGTWSYEWKQGRQLAKMSGSNGIWNFAYDDTGLRTQRINGIKTYNYVYSGSLLRQMTVDGYSFIFRYGVDGRPYSVRFNNTDYFYVLNLQGDVIGIRNKNGTTVVSYFYDAWGNILSTNGSMASTLGALNPLRYRGYVYDVETGLYYLQSRYYNPQWGRFINADGLLDNSNLLGLNLYAYCFNNPVNYFDPSGETPWFLLLIVVGIILCIPSDSCQVPYYEANASKKYNENTISMRENELGNDPDKLNVTFYPNAGLIHIENSYSISSEYEKRAIISVIMDSEYYDPTVYGNSVETMLMEWSGHNFVYHTASSGDFACWIYQKIGYQTPIESTKGVDFRKNLAPSAREKYELITLGGRIHW